jgi:1,4-alpha-glucan branching enzyme
MKNNKKRKSKGNGNGNGTSAHAVHVKFNHPVAGTVAIAGTFNDWRPETTPMVCIGDGGWVKELVLPPGTYEYLFVADGQWLCDPLAQETVPNPFGGRNSVLTVSTQ